MYLVRTICKIEREREKERETDRQRQSEIAIQTILASMRGQQNEMR
jgi:hypothetical protein